MIKDPHKIIIRPVITEKTTQLKGTSGVICFEVARSANKIEIKSAIELLFKTKVAEVRTQIEDRQGPPGRPEHGQDEGLEEGLRPAPGRRETDRILRGGITWVSKHTGQ